MDTLLVVFSCFAVHTARAEVKMKPGPFVSRFESGREVFNSWVTMTRSDPQEMARPTKGPEITMTQEAKHHHEAFRVVRHDSMLGYILWILRSIVHVRSTVVFPPNETRSCAVLRRVSGEINQGPVTKRL